MFSKAKFILFDATKYLGPQPIATAAKLSSFMTYSGFFDSQLSDSRSVLIPAFLP